MNGARTTGRSSSRSTAFASGTEPFRDERGQIVPAGGVGKYFELRDQEGKRQALHPADVRRYEKPVSRPGLPPPVLPRWSKETVAAIKNGKDVFEVRTGKGRVVMSPLDSQRSAAYRTDAQGSFSIETSLSTWRANAIWFASTDFSEQALIVLQADVPDGPVEVTLKPVRQVRARVIVKSKTEPVEEVEWRVFTVDPAVGELDWMRAVRANGEFWGGGLLSDPDRGDPNAEVRQLELYAPQGHYKVNFSSDTLDRFVDFDVPAGNGPVDLPDIELEPRAWFRMLGKPAAEIEAVDLGGKPAKLADYRGKVVIVVFWSTVSEETHQLIARLADIQKRFARQPLAILALHDSSISSVAELSNALGPLREQSAGEIPIRFLVDREPNIKPGVRARMVEFGSGRTAEIYENWSNETMFIITRDGKLAFATGYSCKEDCLFAVGKDRQFVFTDEFSPREGTLETEWQVGSLAVALEDQFGLPNSSLPKPKHTDIAPDEKDELTVFTGKVVDLDGKPVVGAKVASDGDWEWKNAVETGPAGEFALCAEKPWHLVGINVKAAGFASRRL